MSSVAIIVGCSVLAGIVGTAIGWVLRSQMVPADQPLPAPAAPPTPSPVANLALSNPTGTADPVTTATDVMTKLLELTDNVSASLNQHNGEVSAINGQLTNLRDGDAQGVIDVVARLVEKNKAMQSRLETAELKMQAQQRELQTQTQAALTDPLTKLTNRRALDNQLKRCFSDFEQKGRPTTVMVLDIDHFKKFNDTHGHLTGDEVLKYVAQTLKKNADENAIVARYGGEEFAIVIPGESISSAKHKLEKVRSALQESKVNFEGKSLGVTASGGVAEIRGGEDANQLIKRADLALYAAKAGGRNCGYMHNGQDSLPIVTEAPAALAELTSVPAMEPRAILPKPTAPPAAPKLPAVNNIPEFPLLDDLDAAYRENLERRSAEFRRGGASFSIIVALIDQFEQLDTRFGLGLGETVVKVTSHFLRANMRDMDQVVRAGKGGFALLLPGAHGIDAASVVGEHLRKTVERYELPSAQGLVRFTISVGVTEMITGDTAELGFERARVALEAAIMSGCNRCYLHDGTDLKPIQPAVATA